MLSTLRPYQQDLYLKTRQALLHNRAVCLQLHTGGGKTAIIAEMCKSVFGKDKLAWVIVPRKELIRQASEHLTKWNVPHGMIASGISESRAFNVHIVSKDSLIRRYDKIKRFPHLLIIDECHLFLERQIEIISHMPEYTKIIGVTATPERLDGRGLSEVYTELIEGPSIPDLTNSEFLAELKYFSPPLDGLDKLKTRGTEYDEEELEQLLERRKIYGEVVKHYETHGQGRAALVFCRSVKSAHQTAERFRDKGYNFQAIDGTMPDSKVKSILDAHRKGEIDGICNCLLVTYGVDIPRVEYIADISPTLSLNLYMQKIGRGLRPFPGKKNLIYMDHVNQILTHQDSDFPGVPLHYVPHINWNFHGTEKRKKLKSENNIKLCPYLDFMYCGNPHCQNCEHNPDKSVKDARRPMVIIPAELEEKQKPVSFSARPPEERKEISDRIISAVQLYNQDVNHLPNVITELLKVAEELGYQPLWAYHQIVVEKKMINATVLHEIARQKNYSPGWCYYKIKELKKCTA